jgi:hypothetical protein
MNPNEYDDDAYTAATIKLVSALSAMWEAGASTDNIEDELENALREAGVPAGTVLAIEVEG